MRAAWKAPSRIWRVAKVCRSTSRRWLMRSPSATVRFRPSGLDVGMTATMRAGKSTQARNGSRTWGGPSGAPPTPIDDQWPLCRRAISGESDRNTYGRSSPPHHETAERALVHRAREAVVHKQEPPGHLQAQLHDRGAAGKHQGRLYVPRGLAAHRGLGVHTIEDLADASPSRYARSFSRSRRNSTPSVSSWPAAISRRVWICRVRRPARYGLAVSIWTACSEKTRHERVWRSSSIGTET